MFDQMGLRNYKKKLGLGVATCYQDIPSARPVEGLSIRQTIFGAGYIPFRILLGRLWNHQKHQNAIGESRFLMVSWIMYPNVVDECTASLL